MVSYKEQQLNLAENITSCVASIKNENFMSLEKDNKLKYLMNNCIKQVADFLFNSWEKRRELLYASMLLHKTMKVLCYSNTVVM